MFTLVNVAITNTVIYLQTRYIRNTRPTCIITLTQSQCLTNRPYRIPHDTTVIRSIAGKSNTVKAI